MNTLDVYDAPPVVIDRFEADYAFLSNFYQEPCGHTNEHRFQAAKAKDQPVLRGHILACESPGKAKRLGRTVSLDVKRWNKRRVKVMAEGLRTKFSNPVLRDLLLQTDNKVLIEGNHWHDNFWGHCYCNKCKADATLGMNTLGILLMQLRDELRAEIVGPCACGRDMTRGEHDAAGICTECYCDATDEKGE